MNIFYGPLPICWMVKPVPISNNEKTNTNKQTNKGKTNQKKSFKLTYMLSCGNLCPHFKFIWPSSYLALRPDAWTAHRCCAQNIYWQSLEQTETFSHKIISLTYWLSYTSTLLSQNSLTCSLPLARGLVLLTFKVSAPKYKNIWGLCVWQSCVWPTLPSDRTTASLNSAACQDIAVRQHWWKNLKTNIISWEQ